MKPQARRGLYESIMTGEDLQRFRDQASFETKTQGERPYLDRVLERYMRIIEDVYDEQLRMSGR